MGRSPCCSKEGLNRGAWTAHEDKILREYINAHGEGKWRDLPQRAGLKRCGKSCRLRWLNYLRPDIKRGNISLDEEDLIIRLHKLLGNRWSLIAGRLIGRTDNEIKNYWNTHLRKKLQDLQTSTSSAQHIAKITEKRKPQLTPKVTPSISSSPSTLVVRTKASKCSKLILVDPLRHSSMQLQSKSKAELETETEAEPLLVDDAANNSTSNKMEPSVYDNGSLPFPSEEKELSMDWFLDFDIGQVSLPDLLTSDFSDMCDFSYNNNNSKDLLPFSEQPLVSSHEILEDRTQSNYCEENVNGS